MLLFYLILENVICPYIRFNLIMCKKYIRLKKGIRYSTHERTKKITKNYWIFNSRMMNELTKNVFLFIC